MVAFHKKVGGIRENGKKSTPDRKGVTAKAKLSISDEY